MALNQDHPIKIVPPNAVELPSDIPIVDIPDVPLPEQGPRFKSVIPMVPSTRPLSKTLSPA